jgi:hypothetical protein
MLVMPLVRVSNGFPYRGAVFQAGKVYDVEDQPLNFVQHWFGTEGNGEILADESELQQGEVVSPDPRKDKKNVKEEPNLVPVTGVGTTKTDEETAKKSAGSGATSTKEAESSPAAGQRQRTKDQASADEEQESSGGRPQVKPEIARQVGDPSKAPEADSKPKK